MPMGWKIRAAVHSLTALISLATGNSIRARWINEQLCSIPPCGLIGPDGPWRAIPVWVGDTRRGGKVWEVPMYPSGSFHTVVPEDSFSTRYVPDDSSTARKSPLNEDERDAAGPWASVSPRWEFISGNWYFDYTLPIRRMDSPIIYNVNTTILYTDEEFSVRVADNDWEPQRPVGKLGLGLDHSDRGSYPPSYLQQLRNEGVVSSKSFGLSLGSVPMGPDGSFYFGGYDRNRVLGDVAVMRFFEGNLDAFLYDVILGVETGGSPFNRTGDNSTGDLSGKSWSVGSVVGDNASAKALTESRRGPRGAMMTTVNPASPYIYLPSAVCSAVAEYLPVTWQDEIGYYLWDTEDDRFERLVNSPAYMGFVFSDRDRNNVTIKVPFPYLNLSLTRPIVSGDAVPYFPCKPFEIGDSSRSELGRAFLQAAFFAINHDNDVGFLAQGPGRDLEQSFERHFVDFRDDRIESDPIEMFEKSWRNSWTVLEEDAFDHGPSPPSPTLSDGGGDDDNNNRSGSGLATGAIAGIAIGSVAAIALLAGLLFFLLKRRWAQNQNGDGSGAASDPAGPNQGADPKEAYHSVTSNSPASQEMMAQHGWRGTSTLYPPTEMDVPANAHMSMDGSLRFEMDSTQSPTVRRDTYSAAQRRISRVSV